AIDPELYNEHNVKLGLRNKNGTGVIVGLTRIGEVHGYDKDKEGNKIPEEGELYYRGYRVKDLVEAYMAENRFGFEEVCYLLIFGELPDKLQLDILNEYLGRNRELPANFAHDMIFAAPSPNVMNKLARSVLALYAYDDNPDDTDIANVLHQSFVLMGYFPALIAYSYQAKISYFDNKSMHLHYPIPELSTAENILRMIRPDGEYSDLEAKVLDICLCLHAEHGGGNNSSFSTHLVSSTGTDTYAAIASAIGSLKGPRHGGANVFAVGMQEDIKKSVGDINDFKKVDEHLRKILNKEAYDKSGLIYGMGHAVYTLSDPRAIMLKKMARKLAKEKSMEEDFALCQHIEEATPKLFTEVKGIDKPICANVDLYSGFVYRALGIPYELITPLFAVSRLAGWSAHRIEELLTNKRLMRPAYINVQNHKDFVELNAR
ncbi:MAG: citrate synthase, partial [Eggerthellaceae bacterium]|nr:citrate synthase [Eggerthellaceae bacterium]